MKRWIYLLLLLAIIGISPVNAAMKNATFYGSPAQDYGEDALEHSNGDIYFIGFTRGTPPVTSGSYQTSNAGGYGDLIVARMNRSMSTLINATFFGGTGNEGTAYADTIIELPDGNIAITGYTDSDDLPITPGAYCSTYISGSAESPFVAVFNPQLSELINSTYIASSSDTWPNGICTDSNGNITVLLANDDGDYVPPASAYQVLHGIDGGDYDWYIITLDQNLSTQIYATYVGGNAYDEPWRCTYLNNGNLLTDGIVTSPDAPILTTGQNTTSPIPGGSDWKEAFLIFDNRLTRIINGTFNDKTAGDSSSAYSSDMSIDQDTGDIYVIERIDGDPKITTSAGALYNSYQGGTTDVFITRYDSELSTAKNRTYFGSIGDDSHGYADIVYDNRTNTVFIKFGPSNPIVVSSGAYNETFGPLGSAGGTNYVVHMDNQFTTLYNATYTQGWYGEMYLSPSDGYIYLGGGDIRPSMPTGIPSEVSSGAYCSTYIGGSNDMYLISLNTGLSKDSIGSITPTISASPTSGNNPLTVIINDTTSNPDTPLGWEWKLDGAHLSYDRNLVHLFPDSGTFTLTLYITNPSGTYSSSETITITELLPSPWTNPISATDYMQNTILMGIIVIMVAMVAMIVIQVMNRE